MRHVERITRLGAHPLSKCLVMWEQRSVISAPRQTFGLRFRGGVQEAHSDRVKPWR